MSNNQDPNYSEYSDQELKVAYRNWKKLAYNASRMAHGPSYGNCRYHLEQIEKEQDRRSGRQSYSLPELNEDEYYRPW